MMKTKTRLKIISGPMSLVAIVDVFFLLLVFFMISSSLVFWPGTKVETKVRLPRSRINSMNVADKIVITITSSQHLFFNDRNVLWEDLERKLKELVRESRLASAARANLPIVEQVKRARSPLVVLRADGGIPYSRIIDLMSLARSLGLNVYLVTEPAVKDSTNGTGSILGNDG